MPSATARDKRFPGLAAWWDEVELLLAPLLAGHDALPLAATLALLAEMAEALCGPRSGPMPMGAAWPSS
jgi:ATP-dependent helicase/nuclease subunit B